MVVHQGAEPFKHIKAVEGQPRLLFKNKNDACKHEDSQVCWNYVRSNSRPIQSVLNKE